ncbi:MAG: hypothetical protein LBK53_06500 [Heliobacteriaceae bacterium]|jgi:hypothetical protein|nr:hypothetical protein [Heliobacteriaceae bacterium]
MADAKWDFPILSGGTEQGYTNSGIETFRGAELIDNLAREICQNSLDAKDADSKEPVTVEFELLSVKKGDYPLFKEYAECIAGCKKYWENRSDKKVKLFIERAENVLSKEEIKVLRISDYNTTGLTGSDANQNEESVWRALVSADGVSAKNNDTAGGLYGIGKNAPFACSDISVVFYNTYAKDNKKAFQGVARAATLYREDNKTATQGIGHYRSTEKYKPVTADIECGFRDLFSRDKYGTDIIIVGCEKLTEEKDWQDKLKLAIIRNFLLAILENKLVVKIGDQTINNEHLVTMIDSYKEAGSEAAAQTVRLFDTIVSSDGEAKTETVITDNDLEIYLKQNPTYKREIANFRTTGMLVGINKRRMMQNFTAVIVVRGEKLGEILRLTEPPKHNKWDYKLIEDKAKSKEAKKYIDDINEKVKKLIDENYKIDVEDTVDADVGEYLPDELEDLPNKNKQAGEDKLRPVQKILGKPKVVDFPKDSNAETVKQQEGEAIENDESEIRNDGKNPEPYLEPKIPQQIDPIPGGETKGISEGQGSKTRIIYPALKLQRMIAVNYEQGLYKLVLIPINNCERIFVDFSAIGEGSSGDDIAVEKYTLNKRSFSGNGSKTGPFAINADERSEIFVTFKNKEKMVINMEITEEVRQ